MTIKHTKSNNQENKYATLVSCPFCGKEFAENGGMQRTQHLINCDEVDRSPTYEAFNRGDNS